MWEVRHRSMYSKESSTGLLEVVSITGRNLLRACSILASSFQVLFSFPAGLLLEKVLTFNVFLQKTYNINVRMNPSHIQSGAAIVIPDVHIYPLVIQ